MVINIGGVWRGTIPRLVVEKTEYDRKKDEILKNKVKIVNTSIWRQG